MSDAPVESVSTGSDIWLYKISEQGALELARITDRDGYDNQPMFLPDGGRILFTSDRSGRYDTHLYNIGTGTVEQVSFSDADKYSPTPIPGTGGAEFSVVHSDSTIQQGLWRYSIDSAFEPEPITDVDDVAYYTWVGDENVLFWRLNSPSTLQLLDVETSDTTVVADDSVYSFKRLPGEEASVYLASWSGKHSEIREYDWESRQSTVLADALEDGRDFAVIRDGQLLMMNGSVLFGNVANGQGEWEKLGDLGIKEGSRIAVSPDGNMLAVVGQR